MLEGHPLLATGHHPMLFLMHRSGHPNIPFCTYISSFLSSPANCINIIIICNNNNNTYITYSVNKRDTHTQAHTHTHPFLSRQLYKRLNLCFLFVCQLVFLSSILFPPAPHSFTFTFRDLSRQFKYCTFMLVLSLGVIIKPKKQNKHKLNNSF